MGVSKFTKSEVENAMSELFSKLEFGSTEEEIIDIFYNSPIGEILTDIEWVDDNPNITGEKKTICFQFFEYPLFIDTIFYNGKLCGKIPHLCSSIKLNKTKNIDFYSFYQELEIGLTFEEVVNKVKDCSPFTNLSIYHEFSLIGINKKNTIEPILEAELDLYSFDMDMKDKRELCCIFSNEYKSNEPWDSSEIKIIFYENKLVRKEQCCYYQEIDTPKEKGNLQKIYSKLCKGESIDKIKKSIENSGYINKYCLYQEEVDLITGDLLQNYYWKGQDIYEIIIGTTFRNGFLDKKFLRKIKKS